MSAAGESAALPAVGMDGETEAWVGRALEWIGEGSARAVSIEPIGSHSLYRSVSVIGRGVLSRDIHAAHAESVHRRLRSALAARLAEDAERLAEEAEPAHVPRSREVTETRHFYEGEFPVIVRRRESGEERSDVLHWMAECGADGDPLHVRHECGYANIGMKWKFGSGGEWRHFSLDDEQFDRLVRTGGVQDIVAKLTCHWGDLSDFEVEPAAEAA